MNRKELMRRTRETRAKVAAAEAEERAKLTPQERRLRDAGLTAGAMRSSPARVRALGEKFKHEEFE